MGKKEKWDGRSRPSDDNYRKRWNEIFGEKEKVGDIELNKDYKKKLVKHLASLDIFEKE